MARTSSPAPKQNLFDLHAATQKVAAQSDADVAHRVQVAREIEQKAALMQKKLRRQIPVLHRAAEAAPNDEAGEPARRAYLTATQNMLRCQQAYTEARQQRAKGYELLRSPR